MMTSSCCLDLSGEELTSIPLSHYKSAFNYTELRLENNMISVLSNLDAFTNLQTLVLDSNKLVSQQAFSYLPSLKCLWANKNQIDDLDVFIGAVKRAFPNLVELSLIGNSCCPHPMFGGSDAEYSNYVNKIRLNLTTLQSLDCSPLSTGSKILRSSSASGRQKSKQTVAGPSGDEQIYGDKHGIPDPGDRTGTGTSMSFQNYVYRGTESEGNRFIRDSDL